uniref:Uncharacterized protein n=1 Tax=Lactuca sativa TaxID=4236 RepID=A0A9R1X2I0_LACSA|nr:hypothetical protein LSAT_V11C700381850 [Lactuca sativa]
MVSMAYVEVISLASFTGCSLTTFPFTYLGVLVGDSMERVKLFSIGGRLTLTKFVLGSLGSYYFLIFRLPTTVGQISESCRAHFSLWVSMMTTCIFTR